MARPVAREAAMQLVFEQLFGGEGAPQTLVDLLDYQPGEKDAAYIDEVVTGVREHAAEIDAQIAPCLRGWALQRLSRVDLAILRLAAYELKLGELPPGIVVNEAVELANQYSTDKAGAFINGVLGSMVRAKEA